MGERAGRARPVSSGSPHFNGDTVPGVAGAIMVDLRRMNDILGSTVATE